MRRQTRPFPGHLALGGHPIDPHLWIIFTLLAAGGQTVRNAMQRGLIETLGAIGAAQVRFVFGLPFSLAFLTLACGFAGRVPPAPDAGALAWIGMGAAAQIAATALMLATMRQRSFVVATAYTKTEPIQVAVFAFLVLGERATALVLAGIIVASAGVVMMSWPRAGAAAGAGARGAWTGLSAGACFALSVIAFRAAILRLDGGAPLLGASAVLVLSLLVQSGLVFVYLVAFDRATARAILAAWRQSLLAGLFGALASQFWFFAFALQASAQVRTLGLVEMLFAQFVSTRVLGQRARRREVGGIVLLMAGVGLLLNG